MSAGDDLCDVCDRLLARYTQALPDGVKALARLQKYDAHRLTKHVQHVGRPGPRKKETRRRVA